MADSKISALIQRTPDGTEYFEVIIPPFTPGTNRKVLLSDLAAILGGAVDSVTGTAVDNTDPENPVIDLPSPTVMTYSTETATHELDATDLASVNAGESLTIRMNAAGAIDLEIPTNAVQAFAVGTIIGLEQMGVGQLTIVPDGGVTLRSPNSANKTYAQYSKAYIEKVGTNEWLLSGDITV